MHYIIKKTIENEKKILTWIYSNLKNNLVDIIYENEN